MRSDNTNATRIADTVMSSCRLAGRPRQSLIGYVVRTSVPVRVKMKWAWAFNGGACGGEFVSRIYTLGSVARARANSCKQTGVRRIGSTGKPEVRAGDGKSGAFDDRRGKPTIALPALEARAHRLLQSFTNFPKHSEVSCHSDRG